MIFYIAASWVVLQVAEHVADGVVADPVGTDLSDQGKVLHRQVHMTIKKVTDDILMYPDIPGYVGAIGNPAANVGSVENTGIEVEVKLHDNPHVNLP